MWVISLKFQITESCSVRVEDRCLNLVHAKGRKTSAIVRAWIKEVVGRMGEERETPRLLTGERMPLLRSEISYCECAECSWLAQSNCLFICFCLTKYYKIQLYLKISEFQEQSRYSDGWCFGNNTMLRITHF